MSDPDVKLFFLVAGFEYSDKQLDFWKYCTGRVRERIAFIDRMRSRSNALVDHDCTLRFLRFSVGTGKIEVIDRQFTKSRGVKETFAGESDWKPLSSVGTGDIFDPDGYVSKGPFRAINKATDYDMLPGRHEPSLIQDARTSDIMSITDVYESVRNAPSESVLEFSIFSHGWVEGAILTNSSDLIRDPDLRDTTDKDGRSLLDFNLRMGQNHGTVPSLNLPRFVDSFDAKGIMQTWGCNFDIELRVVQQTQKQIRKGSITDNTVIDFHFEDWAPDRYAVVDPGAGFLPAVSTQTNMSRKFSEVKKFLRKRLQKSYAFQFASKTSKTGLGALPGTQAEDEKTGFRMMKVCAKEDPPECNDGFGGLFNFFSKHIGVKVDDRGYGIFDRATVDKLLADIAVDGP